LRAGHDVVVPQLLGRPGFVTDLERAAHDAGARFRRDRADARQERHAARPLIARPRPSRPTSPRMTLLAIAAAARTWRPCMTG